MSRPETNLLDRALAALTISVEHAKSNRAAALADGYSGEWVQQVHVKLSGVLGTDWGSADGVVNFDLPFLYAPDQRQVPFEVPHFTYGIEFTGPVQGAVVITASVLEWIKADQGWIIGANMRYCVLGPPAGGGGFTSLHAPVRPGAPIRAGVTTPSGPTYSAVAHLTFQGYAAPAEGSEFQ